MLSVVSENNIRILEELAGESPEGCFVEVGVWRGGTAKHLEDIARVQNRKFYAYDTFEGMPFALEGEHPVGDFGDTNYEEVKQGLPYTIVVKGIFPESAVEMPPIAFAHIDCDQYKSIKDSCLYLQDKMAPGGIMYFDDYNVLPLAKKAVDELYKNIQTASNGKVFVTF